LDEEENVRYTGKNVQIVTPYQRAAGYVPPSIKMEDETSLVGNLEVIPEILDFNWVKPNNSYKITFAVDTVGHLRPMARFRSKYDLLYVNNGFSVYNITEGDSLVYQETPDKFPMDNLLYDIRGEYWYFNENLTSDPFEGLQITINSIKSTAEFDPERSGWITGDAPIRVTPSTEESKYFPWQYEIIFTGEDSSYVSIVTSTQSIKNVDNLPIADYVLLGQPFNFYVINKSFPDSNGVYEKLDLVVEDVNENGEFDLSEDKVLVGHTFKFGSNIYWGGTVFAIDFHDAIAVDQMPKPNDVYRVDFKRPFIETDFLVFTVCPGDELAKEELKNSMDNIKVVPNPYIATNAMEPAVSNPFLNQRRRLLFTHIPAYCTIKIFTSSGVFVDEIKVDNPPDKGIVHWDMLTKEGLEIAPGIYIYYVRSNKTGQEKLGKFAVVK